MSLDDAFRHLSGLLNEFFPNRSAETSQALETIRTHMIGVRRQANTNEFRIEALEKQSQD